MSAGNYERLVDLVGLQHTQVSLKSLVEKELSKL